MKKTIFDLDKKELKELDKEFNKSYYVKNIRLFSKFILILLCIVIVGDMIISFIDQELMIMNDTIFFIGIFLYIVLEQKRFIMLKKFYDEKYVNDNKIK